MSSKKALILGYDAVSPLGTDLDTQWQRAVAGDSGIGKLTRFPFSADFPVRVAGQVADIDSRPYPFLQPREMAHWTSPIFKYALLVVHRALEKSGIVISADIAPRVAVTFSTAVGGLDAVLQADRLMVAEGKMPHPFTNPNSCITSLIIGEMLLQRDMADVVIGGAVDFPLVEPIVAGFATMNGAYRPKEGQPEELPEKTSRPFSINRRGFVVSEGAGCIILATEEFAKAHGLKPKIEMAGWSMTSDASHFVSPKLETVQETIANAGLRPDDIDAINAHATSTKVGDKVEADALHNIFGNKVPPVSANKSQLGHAMGASSAIEAILAIEGMLKDTLLPTINYIPDPEITIDCVAEGARKLKQEFVLKNAFGFGGCNSCLILHRIA
jgi:3-oxoacyl-[acyl-carrier-protein] synthase II